MTQDLQSPGEIEGARSIASALLDGLNSIVFGQEELTRALLAALLARGHVLLEGLPGLGKTELVKGLARLTGLSFGRLQFTPDLLPGDITGGHLLEERGGSRELVFHPGPVFTQILLADEINRASPKTQSALLEAMQEQRVTVLGETRELPQPFLVLATQNPIELEGTYPLPEAQLDRFLFKLDVGGVNAEVMTRILLERRGGRPPEVAAVTNEAGLAKLHAVVDAIYLPAAVAEYISRLVSLTHARSAGVCDEVRKYVKHGASPRAAIAMAEGARGFALLAGKPNVGFDDVRAVAAHALVHRLVLDYRARLDEVDGHAVVAAVLRATPEVGEALPAELEAR